ncbi:hypothetical protein BM221_004812 [Beauveria bassiana]|uniref:CrcB-like protein n=1 Tax=Beauveria bassiana TaxID=176275 RepID=A0A2N6NSC7_BEABA|nr:hypothetical protein BM221_004812 [Beauveria bassiana]
MASDAAVGSGGLVTAKTDAADAPYDVPDQYENLDEVAATGDTLDDIRRGEAQQQQQQTPPEEKAQQAYQVSRLATQLYTLSYLVFFSFLGTLARVGLSHLTNYPGAPSIFPTLWANVGGSFIMGFLVEDRKLFRHDPDLHGAAPAHRNGGYSFMALLAVIIETVGLSLGAYIAGMHLGAALEPYTPSIPFRFARGVLDKLAVLLGWGCWLGAILLAIFPPRNYWRGTAVFAMVFAPLGTLARFYLSMLLNAKRPSFPLGTFAANVLGTAILGMAWDIAHSAGAGRGVLGCQLPQGVEDGFCGCLTTVSTWVSELCSLRRRSAYVYGLVSVVLSTALMIAIMGGLRWTRGFAPLQCHP